MNRIFFRAWCKETKQMYYHIDNIGWSLGGALQGCRSVISETEEHIMTNNYDGKENFVLLQYTGIIDSNKKHIFEGDYCKVTIPDKNGTPITRIVANVQYDNTYASFRLGYMSSTNMNIWHNIGFTPDLKIEVIGNIYETDFTKLVKSHNRDFKIDSLFDE